MRVAANSVFWSGQYRDTHVSRVFERSHLSFHIVMPFCFLASLSSMLLDTAFLRYDVWGGRLASAFMRRAFVGGVRFGLFSCLAFIHASGYRISAV